MLVVHLYRILQLDSSGRVILAALVFTRIHRNAAPVLEDMDTEQAVAEASRLLNESDSAAEPGPTG